MTNRTDLLKAVDDMMGELTAHSDELQEEIGRQAALWNILKCVKDDMSMRLTGPTGKTWVVIDAKPALRGLNRMVEDDTLDEWIGDLLKSAEVEVTEVTHQVLHARSLLDERGALRIVVEYRPPAS